MGVAKPIATRVAPGANAHFSKGPKPFATVGTWLPNYANINKVFSTMLDGDQVVNHMQMLASRLSLQPVTGVAGLTAEPEMGGDRGEVVAAKDAEIAALKKQLEALGVAA